MFNESGCERNWAYENIVYNKPLDENRQMIGDSEYFTDFPAQRIESGLFTAFWDTGSTWNAQKPSARYPQMCGDGRDI